jgi:hypothetical protein
METPVSDGSSYAPSAAAGLHVDVDVDIAGDARERIKQSIGAMAQHFLERRERQREVDAHARALRAAIMAPLNKVIEADPAAKEAITSAVAQAQRSAALFRPDPLEFPTVRPQDLLFDLPPGARALQVFAPPFHFPWRWHAGSHPPEALAHLDRPTGSIGVAHNAGHHDDRWVTHHAGFGVSLSTDREKIVTARSLRRTSYWYWVDSSLYGGAATVEGGTEMTVVENGTLIRSAEDKAFRKRASGGEDEFVHPDGFATGNSIEVSWTMIPGSTYEFNVGAWVFCATEQPDLVPDSARASADLQAKVIAMTVDEN